MFISLHIYSSNFFTKYYVKTFKNTMARKGFFFFKSGPRRIFFSKSGPPTREVAHPCCTQTAQRLIGWRSGCCDHQGNPTSPKVVKTIRRRGACFTRKKKGPWRNQYIGYKQACRKILQCQCSRFPISRCRSAWKVYSPRTPQIKS